MPRYKAQERNGLLVPVVLSEQLVPGSFAFALQYLVDSELDLSALDARYRNEMAGASAYDPRVLLKIVLLAYNQGIVSSRAMERVCAVNVQFMAISGDAQPGHSVLAAFVSGMGEQIKSVFSQVLMVCDAQGLIGRQMFAIDGVKLPSNASKERSGTHAELLHRAQRLERAAEKIVAEHQAQDKQGNAGQPMPAQRQRRSRRGTETAPPEKSRCTGGWGSGTFSIQPGFRTRTIASRRVKTGADSQGVSQGQGGQGQS